MIFTNFCWWYLSVVTSLLAQLEGHMEGEQKGMARLLQVATVSIAKFAWQELLRGEKKEHRQTLRKGKNQIYK